MSSQDVDPEDESTWPKLRPGQHRCERMDCPSVAKHLCAGCKNAWYCSRECQKGDWKWHVFRCKTKIRSSRHLIKACFDDTVPNDPQAMEDFGFNRAGPRCWSLVLGVYIGLNRLHDHALDPLILEQWLKSGTLAQHIEENFEKLPVQSRGGYYPWFQENRWIFDGSPGPGGRKLTADQEKEMDRKLWEFLGTQRKAQSESWSQPQTICAAFFRLILSDLYPSPLDAPEVYIHFGFCTAKGRQQEAVVGRLYTALLQKCTFEEFCAAYAASELFELFQDRGIITDHVRRTLPRHFEHVVTFPWGTEDEPVWNLKQWLFAGGKGMPMVSSADVVYAFGNCRSPKERDTLAEVYRTAFKHKDFDELELHQHSIQRSLHTYLPKFHYLTKKEREKLHVPFNYMIPRFH